MAVTYAYKVKDKQGKLATGTIEAENETAVVAKLRQSGYLILNVTKKSKSALSLEISLPFLGGVKVKDLTIFSRQFATMVNAGLPLTKCLSILAEQTKNRTFAKSIAGVSHDVESGQSLSESMDKHPKVFPKLYTTMTKAGETGGVLDEVLLRVADHYEKESELKGKIKSAMAYPAAMFSFAMIIVFLMIIFIVPVFVKMFAEMGGTLPLPTRILLGINTLISGFWWLLLAITIAVIYGYRWFSRTGSGRLLIDRIKLSMPVFGVLSQKIAIAKFSRTLGTLIATGVPILQALDIVADTAGNEVVVSAVRRARTSIKEGETIAKPLGKSKVFPSMVVHMIAVGEETGALHSMLSKVADFYDREVAATVDALTSLIEPFMIVGMGLIIGGILIALYLPMFKMVTLIK